MANQIAKSMSADDKGELENMDMQEMISHVTKNVFGMMNQPNNPMAEMFKGMSPEMMNQSNNPMAEMFKNMPPGMMPPGMIPPETNLSNNIKFDPSGFSLQEIDNSEESESDESESNCIFAKTNDICFELNVDLKDFYTGKKKKLNVKRKVMKIENGKQTIIEEKKKLIIPIEKGMKDEQQIRFEGEADQIPGYKPGDIIITLIENEHPDFQRDGDNLIMIKNINLYQNYDYTFDIKHLDDTVYRIKNIQDEALHLNDSIRKISKLGMPSYKSNNNYGDLFIRFNLVLPKMLNEMQLQSLNIIFKDDPLFLENKLCDSFDKTLILENVSDTDLEELENLYTDSEEESSEEESSEEESSESSEESSEEDCKKKSLNKK